MTTVSASTAATLRGTAPTAARLRVVLMLNVRDGAQDRFLDVYEELRHQVASVPGHVSDQLCQSIEDPSQWLITSEWDNAQQFLDWVDSESHRAVVKPMHSCVEQTRSLRYTILRETAGTHLVDGPAPVLDGIVRHAITFTVRPGSEQKVAELLSGYDSPRARVDDRTRLLRTSLFLHGNRVVRAVEVAGDLGAALRHVAMQPEVRAVEEAINPFLEEDRDLSDPESARSFFVRAALPLVQHVAAPGTPGRVGRYALHYPVRPGCGAELAALLAEQDRMALEPGGALVASSLFHRDDVVVRMVDLRTEPTATPAAAVGLADLGAAGRLAALLDPTEPYELHTEPGLCELLRQCATTLLTDRRAAGA
ncbi:SchA/CurD-like domain-containing protein [Kitasatospora sp. NPDC052896]|uniref:SchA/CurD-like domain-containing protein n=1 Tax=Kitasatospora sp. NPDC052896 TaxID=3364061 RepID=UPI0037CBFC32